MNAFDDIGHAMLLAQEGREQLARLVWASLRQLGARVLVTLGKTPATDVSLDRPSRSF